MTDFSKILDKAKELESKMMESQEKIKKIKAEILAETLKEDKLIIEDLIVAAHNNAKAQLKIKTSEEISKTTGGFGIPGFKWPL